MVYNSVKEVLDSQDASIMVNNADEFSELMEECEALGFRWDHYRTARSLAAMRCSFMYPTNIAKLRTGYLEFGRLRENIPYNDLKGPRFIC
jgi:hypothetical protein